MEMEELSGYGFKNCLTDASLGWKCFRKYNKNRDIYKFTGKYVRDFIRKSIKGGRVSALADILNRSGVKNY